MCPVAPDAAAVADKAGARTVLSDRVYELHTITLSNSNIIVTTMRTARRSSRLEGHRDGASIEGPIRVRAQWFEAFLWALKVLTGQKCLAGTYLALRKQSCRLSSSDWQGHCSDSLS